MALTDSKSPTEAAGNPASITSGGYPFYRTFSLTTWEADNVKNPLAEKLVNFLLKQEEPYNKDIGIIQLKELMRMDFTSDDC